MHEAQELTHPPVLVAGAGIAGLTAALALAARGFETTVLERRAEPAETGTGLSLGANSTHLLRDLGLGPVLMSAGNVLERAEWRLGRSGWTVAVSASGTGHEAMFGAPMVNLRRADLHAGLLRAARAERRIRILTGREVVGVAEDDAGVTLGTSDGERHRGLVAIGADGIHSRVRGVLLGEGSGPRPAGEIAWRAIVPSSALPAKERLNGHFVFWLGRDRHALAYPMGGPDAPWINVGAFVKTTDPPGASWTLEGDPSAMRAAFAGWDPRLQRLLAAVDRCYLLSMHQHEPPRQWSRGRVALLGDACHAMLPHAGQGAGMAIEDAVVLARALRRRPDDPVAALAEYGTERGPRVRRVMGMVQAMGAQFRIAHPVRRAAFYTTLRLVTWARPDAIVRRTAWLYGFDAASEVPAPETVGAPSAR